MDLHLFQQALNVSDPWKITSVDFDIDNKRLDICIDFTRGATFSDNEEPDKKYKVYDTVKKTWKQL